MLKALAYMEQKAYIYQHNYVANIIMLILCWTFKVKNFKTQTDRSAQSTESCLLIDCQGFDSCSSHKITFFQLFNLAICSSLYLYG